MMSTMRRNTDRKKRKRELEGFAARLKQLRENNNLTLRELAEDIGIGRSTLGEYENAETDPSLSHVRRIADYFGVSIDRLAGE